MQKQNKIMIFDMDGVILDSEPLHQNAREILYKKYKIYSTENHPNPVGKSSSGFWELVAKRNGRIWDSDQMEKEQYDLVAEQVRNNNQVKSKGLKELLCWCVQNGWLIGLASSSTRRLVEQILEALHIRQYFDVIVCGDEVKNKKSAPDIYEKVLKLAGVNRNNAFAVEDSDTGIAAAKRAGIFCYGYRNKSSGQQKLSEADEVIDHLKEIMEKKENVRRFKTKGLGGK